MTEKAKSKVLAVRSIWLGTKDKPYKVSAGTVVELSSDQIKHFGKAVTKDLPDEEE